MVGPGASVLEIAGARPSALLSHEQLRERLPLALVCNELYIAPDSSGKALCPMHDDHSPSFELYEDARGVEKFACRPCGVSGDVFDLLQRLEGLSFGASVERARALLDDLEDRGMRPQTSSVSRRQPFDRSEAAAEALRARERVSGENVGWLCLLLGLVPEATDRNRRELLDTWLVDRWEVGIGPKAECVFPHRDALGTLRGVKFKAALGGDRWALPGSEFVALYGAWHPRKHRAVLLCEGETDTLWAAAHACASDQPVDVLGLPSGAGRVLPEWAALEADIYFLAFDGDPAGDEATRKVAELWPGRDVRRLRVPRGEDLRSWRPDIGAALRSCDTMENPWTTSRS